MRVFVFHIPCSMVEDMLEPSHIQGYFMAMVPISYRVNLTVFRR